jgi:hypothetical protein
MITLIKNHQKELENLCRRYNVQHLEIFGSAASGEGFDNKTSDIDFLVEFLPMEPREHARAYFGLLEALQDMFARPIDLVEIRAINNPYLIESINESRSQIYAA